MIIRDPAMFHQAVQTALQKALVTAGQHQIDAWVAVGDECKGHYLFADGAGWVRRIDGIHTAGYQHIASPITNLQAAVVAIS
jgi:hypothetical protein